MADIIDRLRPALADRYQIERELGQGGMATVYLAGDLKHDRQVAIKVLRPELAAVVGAERFLSEIRTTANLQHPHILPLFASGEADGFLYYVMPYMAGETLRDRLDREGQLPVDEAVAITRKVGSALDYAHRNGVIHRDIKPANILLEDGEPQVADFGIALAVQQAGGGRLTETGLSLGTPYYMSPEQATGERDPDPRSDLYSLGCVAFEMLAGEPPFTGSSAQGVLAKILTDDAPIVTQVRKTVPANVASAIARATQRLPADRFATIGDFNAALGDPGYRWGGLAGGAAGAGAGGGGVARWLWPAATGALAIATIAFASMAMREGAPSSSAPLALRVVMPDSQGITNPTDFLSAAVSDDGSTLVYVGPEPPNGTQLWVKRRSEVEGYPLRGTSSPTMFTVSPDGSEVAYVLASSSALAAISTGGGTPRILADSALSLGGDWADDGFIYFQNFRSGMSRVPEGGGDVELLIDPTELDRPSGDGDFAWPQLLPGGRHLLVSMWGTTPAGDSIALFDLETREIQPLAVGVNAEYLSPGYLLVGQTDRTLSAAPFDLEAGRLTGPLRSIIDGLRNVQSGALDFRSNAQGTLLYVTGGGTRGRPVWVTREGETTVVQEDWVEDFSAVTLSPDGTRLAASTRVGTRQEIWARSSEVGDIPPQRRSFGETEVTRPVFAPDGERILYIGAREGGPPQTQILARRWDGTGGLEVVVDAPQMASERGVQEVDISSDGRWLVYRVGGGNVVRDIFVFEIGRDTVGRPLIAELPNEHSPGISPGGRFIAYGSNESGSNEVFVRTFPDLTGGKWVVSTEGGTEPLWSADGSEIFYRDRQGTLMASRWSSNGGVTSLEELFDARGFLADPVHTTYAVHPDGRFLMVELAENPETGLVWLDGLAGLLAETVQD
ncbi:MAG: serine/threonine-protein kinase [Gemmatimonadetes bacterium]|nr:serine/threonine-protein kinase [Gemmatimonadota bacterium]